MVDLSSSGLSVPSSGIMNVGTLAHLGDAKYKKGDFSLKNLRFYPSLNDTAYSGNEDDLIQIYEGDNAMPSFEINWAEMNKLSGGTGYAGLYDKLNAGNNIVIPNGNKAIRESRYKQSITGYVSLTENGERVDTITLPGVPTEEGGTVATESTYYITVARGDSGYDIPVSEMLELGFAVVPNDEASVELADASVVGAGGVTSTSGNKSTFEFVTMRSSTDVEMSFTVYVWSKVGHATNKSKTVGGKTYRWNDSGFSFTVIQEAYIAAEPGHLSFANPEIQYTGELYPEDVFKRYSVPLFAYLSEYQYNTGEFGSSLGQIYCAENHPSVHVEKAGVNSAISMLNSDLAGIESPVYITVATRDDAAGELAQCLFGFELSVLDGEGTFCERLISLLETLRDGTNYDMQDSVFYVTETTLISSDIDGTIVNSNNETFDAYVYAELTDGSGNKTYQKLGECLFDQDDELAISVVPDAVPHQYKFLRVSAIVLGIKGFAEGVFELTNTNCVLRNGAYPTNNYKIANSSGQMISNFANASLGITAGRRFPILTTSGSETTMSIDNYEYTGNPIICNGLNFSITVG